MSDRLTMVASLKQAFCVPDERFDSGAVDPAVTLCADMIMAGETVAAREFLGEIESKSSLMDGMHKLQVTMLRVKILAAEARFQEGLDEVSTGRERHAQILAEDRSEFLRLRILECSIQWQMNDSDRAIQGLRAIRAELLQSPDSELLAACTLNLFSALMMCGEYAEATKFAMEAIVSARRSGDRYTEAIALDNYGRLQRMLCQWNGALQSAQLANVMFEELGFRKQRNACLRGIGVIAWKRGRLSEAAAIAEQCISEASNLGFMMHECYGWALLGLVHLHAGRFEESAHALATARERIPGPQSRPSLLIPEYEGEWMLEQGDHIEAAKVFSRVLEETLAIAPRSDVVGELRRRIAECLLFAQRYDESRREALAALEHCERIGDVYEEATVYRILAMLAAHDGQRDEAEKWFKKGVGVFEDIDTPYEFGKLLVAYGDWVLERSGGQERGLAGTLFRRAHQCFLRGGATARAAWLEEKIAKTTDGARGHSVAHRKQSVGSDRSIQRISWARESFGLVTCNAPFLRLLEDVAKLARSKAAILVLGESGCGKELVAHGIHRLSGRTGNFIPVNCGALPREIIESELFGHVAGAFTGAGRDKQGLFEVCSGGTVFLDEVAEMPVDLQSRLLRFLETGEVRRVGATRNISVETRVVAATNRPRAALEKGDGFRIDLYYRLAHAVIELPPLRRRPDDIELLVEHFLAEACVEEERAVRLSPGALEKLKNHSWPGNVRQLKAVLKRAVILAPDGQEIGADELPLDEGRVATTLLEELEIAERRRIEEVMREVRGSRTEAAKALGMPRTTLINKLKRLGLAK